MDNSGLNLEIPLGFDKHSRLVGLPDGKYKGVIQDIKVKNRILSGQKVLEYTVEVKRGDGTKAIVKLSPFYDINSEWLQSVLKNLGHKLIGGKSINIEKDIGAKVRVEICNVQKDGKTYCNIVRMTKIESSSKADDDKASGTAKNESKPKPKARFNDPDDEDPDDEDLDLDEDKDDEED